MTNSPPTSHLGKVMSQAGLVLGISVSFALIANHFSPRGLSLSRDYFPSAPSQQPSTTGNTAPPSTHEFATATRTEVEAFTRDPRYVTQKFLLIDARNLATYQAGHIPGAMQYDHFRPTENIAQIAPACLAAEKIILYCHGGNCEDSIFAARVLVGYGVPASRLSIYEAGFHDWQSANLPIQTSSP